MIEEKPPRALGKDEVLIIESHIADCSNCRHAYEAAQVSEALIRARADETIAPSPFFKTRVMSAIRQNQLSPEPPAILKMWRAAGALVSALTALVAILIGVTFYVSSNNTPSQLDGPVASGNLYSVEYLEFERADDGATNDQVLGTIYDSEGGDGQ